MKKWIAAVVMLFGLNPAVRGQVDPPVYFADPDLKEVVEATLVECPLGARVHAGCLPLPVPVARVDASLLENCFGPRNDSRADSGTYRRRSDTPRMTDTVSRIHPRLRQRAGLGFFDALLSQKGAQHEH